MTGGVVGGRETFVDGYVSCVGPVGLATTGVLPVDILVVVDFIVVVSSGKGTWMRGGRVGCGPINIMKPLEIKVSLYSRLLVLS